METNPETVNSNESHGLLASRSKPQNMPQNDVKKPEKTKDKRQQKNQSPVKKEYGFMVDDISKDKAASGLIADLVECYTSNSKLPPNELKALNKKLYNRTVSVFSTVLNSCVEKILSKLVSNNYLKNMIVDNGTVMKDASCQTDFSYYDFLGDCCEEEESDES